MQGFSVSRKGRELKEELDMLARLAVLEERFSKSKSPEGRILYRAFENSYDLIVRNYDPNKGCLEAYVQKVIEGAAYGIKYGKSLNDGLDDYIADLTITEKSFEMIEREEDISEIMCDFFFYNLPNFVLLARRLQDFDTSRIVFSESYLKKCKIVRNELTDKVFGCEVVKLYNFCAEELTAFLAENEDNQEWKNADNLPVNYDEYEFYDRYGEFLSDIDSVDYWYISSQLPQGYKFVKVSYKSYLEAIKFELRSKKSNELKFWLKDNYIYRYFSGILSEKNADSEKVAEHFMDEFIANIGNDLGGKLIHYGSENLYFITRKRGNLAVKPRLLRGIAIIPEFEIINLGGKVYLG